MPQSTFSPPPHAINSKKNKFIENEDLKDSEIA